MRAYCSDVFTTTKNVWYCRDALAASSQPLMVLSHWRQFTFPSAALTTQCDSVSVHPSDSSQLTSSENGDKLSDHMYKYSFSISIFRVLFHNRFVNVRETVDVVFVYFVVSVMIQRVLRNSIHSLIFLRIKPRIIVTGMTWRRFKLNNIERKAKTWLEKLHTSGHCLVHYFLYITHRIVQYEIGVFTETLAEREAQA